jgi:hypothetical protein
MKAYQNSTNEQKAIVEDYNRLVAKHLEDLNALAARAKGAEASFPGTNESGQPVLAGCVFVMSAIQDVCERVKAIYAYIEERA